MTDCWALITGATRGVGLYAARGFAENGCDLIIAARRRVLLQETASEIEAIQGVKVYPIAADLRLESEVRQMIETALKISGKRLRVVFMSYGNPICEPSHLEDTPWSCWLEASSLYLASTSRILSIIGLHNKIRSTIAAVTSFTTLQPHSPLVVADSVRRGLPTILYEASRRWPDRIQGVLVVLGSFRTPGAEETIRLLSGGDLERFWKEKVEGISVLGAGSEDDLKKLAKILLDLPDYILFTPIYLEGGNLEGPFL